MLAHHWDFFFLKQSPKSHFSKKVPTYFCFGKLFLLKAFLGPEWKRWRVRDVRGQILATSEKLSK